MKKEKNNGRSTILKDIQNRSMECKEKVIKKNIKVVGGIRCVYMGGT